jgi:hypothetical protein
LGGCLDANVSLPNTFDIIDVKDPKIPFYCALKNMRPSLMIVMYTNFRNLNVRFFVLVRLHDPKHVHVWTKKIKNDIMKDENDFRMFKVPQWVLVKKTNKLG